MSTQEIWQEYNQEIYFFILKKVQNKAAANDILQNTFLKIHGHLLQLQDQDKLKAWIFQITRNEITNHFNLESRYVEEVNPGEGLPGEYENICCFDNFINELPEIYKEPIELVYLQGKKQKETSELLEISLANVKARIRRGKAILQKKFNECCNYQFDKNGKLTGQPNCPRCAN